MLNTQVLIFEALAKLSPKGSVAKEILTENSQMLKTKNGVECIDVNHFIELLFERAGYSDILDQETLLDTISIKETFSNMDSVEELVDIILEKTKKKKKGFPDLNKDGKVTKADVLVGRGVIKAETEVEEEEPRVEEEETPEVEAPEQEKADESPPDEEKEEDLEEKTKEVPTSDEIMSSFKNFEDILNSIDFDSLEGDENEEEEEESEEASEEEAEVDKKEEGEE